MRQEHIQGFPVVDEAGALTGNVLECNLNHTSATSARCLSVWELNYLITQIKVESGMSLNVISVTENPLIEESTTSMADSEIGGQPGKRAGEVVGIITEANPSKLFFELSGGTRRRDPPDGSHPERLRRAGQDDLCGPRCGRDYHRSGTLPWRHNRESNGDLGG